MPASSSTLNDVLASKGEHNRVIYVNDTDTLLAATQMMCDNTVGAVLVKSASEETAGVLSERDILRFCSQRHQELDRVKVSEVMTRDLIVSKTSCTIAEAQAIMTEKKFRHMPVVEEGKVIGMISQGDLVRIQLEKTDVEVNYLRSYIAA